MFSGYGIPNMVACIAVYYLGKTATFLVMYPQCFQVMEFLIWRLVLRSITRIAGVSLNQVMKAVACCFASGINQINKIYNL